jgi:hypothetical protein
MLVAIFRYLSSEGLPISIACLLWMAIFDDKLRDGLKKVKWMIYGASLCYFFTIAMGVLKVVSHY